MTHPSLGLPTTCGSFALADAKAKANAPIVEKVHEPSLVSTVQLIQAKAIESWDDHSWKGKLISNEHFVLSLGFRVRLHCFRSLQGGKVFQLPPDGLLLEDKHSPYMLREEWLRETRSLGTVYVTPRKSISKC